MEKKKPRWKRMAAFLLALLLICNLGVTALATSPEAEAPPGVDAVEPQPEPVPESISPYKRWLDRVDFLENQESALDVEYIVPQSAEVMADNPVMPMATGDHKYKNVQLHVLAKFMLSKPFKMPNGKLRKAVDSFAMDLDHNGRLELDEKTYCLDPYTDIGSNAHYDSVETPSGSNVKSAWGKLSFTQQNAIGLVLLYGHGCGYTDTTSPNDIMDQMATQIILHEVVLGYRDSVAPFRRTNSAYIDAVLAGGEFVEGTWLDNGWIPRKMTTAMKDRLRSTYNDMRKKLASHVPPSFTSNNITKAPSHKMSPYGSGKYQVKLRDTNEALPGCTFPKLKGMTFSKSSNLLTATADSYSSIPTGVIKAVIGVKPNPGRSAYLVWSGTPTGGKTQDQICVKPNGAKSDPLPVYFKLWAEQYGAIEIEKVTNDGGNLGGWEFELLDSHGKRVGTYKTDSKGHVTIRNLLPGSYTVKEIGNTDQNLELSYKCTSKNPQVVKVNPGKISSVTVSNRQIAHVKILKKMLDGGPVEGWQFKVTDSKNQEIPGSPFTSDLNGEIQIKDLLPGTYTVEELIPTDSAYECKSQNPQKVTIKAGETGVVTFENGLKGAKIELVKSDPNMNYLPGAKFLLEWSEDNVTWKPVTFSKTVAKGGCSTPELQDGCLTTGESSYICWDGLHPGLYYQVTEVQAPDGYQLLEEPVFTGQLPADKVLTLWAINTPEFRLPATGASDFRMLPALVAVTGLLLVGIAYVTKRKEK